MPKRTATLPARNEQKNEQKAAKPEPASQRTPFKPGTMLSLRTPLDAQISPDGRYVAFLVNEYVPERPKARPRLWLAPVDGGEAHPVALATGDDRGEDSCPRWSPYRWCAHWRSVSSWQSLALRIPRAGLTRRPARGNG